jgi:hypothetical protein
VAIGVTGNFDRAGDGESQFRHANIGIVGRYPHDHVNRAGPLLIQNEDLNYDFSGPGGCRCDSATVDKLPEAPSETP